MRLYRVRQKSRDVTFQGLTHRGWAMDTRPAGSRERLEPARDAQFDKRSPGLMIANGGLGKHGAKGAFEESGNGTALCRAKRVDWG